MMERLGFLMIPGIVVGISLDYEQEFFVLDLGIFRVFWDYS